MTWNRRVPDRAGAGSLERNPDLVLAGVYEREVLARIESVWENVFDWEHLPWLHSQAFSSIELRASGDWGWHADVAFPGDAQAEIELVVDRDRSRYVARTLEGAGAPGEIWTHLDAVEEDRTRIRVEFCLSPLRPAALDQLGAAYVALYTGLWDQDEAMMRTREQAFAARANANVESADPRASMDSEATSGADSVDLGSWRALSKRLPMVVEFAGQRFRIVELAGRPVAHSVECPHRLGPLAECPVEEGVVTCPWHGYRFDVASGRSADGRSLRLRPAPRLAVDAQTDRVCMFKASGSENAARV